MIKVFVYKSECITKKDFIYTDVYNKGDGPYVTEEV